MAKVWIRTALFNFFIAACLGTLLRLAFVVEIPWLKYQYFQHAHSHIAMLGWIYLGLYALLIHSYLKPDQQRSKKYHLLFWLTQVSVIGMLITFPCMGYAGWSIFFSTMQMLLSYVFLFYFWQDLRQHRIAPYSKLFIKTALGFMLLSTLALWAMVPIMALGFKGSAIYYMAVQFFLHFQFNGWFIFAVLGLLFHWLEGKGWTFSSKLLRFFYVLLFSSCLLTYALAVAWANPLPLVFAINSTGVGLQLAALVAFTILLKKAWQAPPLSHLPWVRFLILFAIGCFVIKILVQAVIVLPVIAKVAYTIRNFVIGFIHLINLGVISSFILGYSIQQELLDLKNIKTGLVFFMMGLIGSELLLFFQGILLWSAKGFLPFYYELLFLISGLMVVGLGWIQLSPFLRAITSRIFEADS